MCDAHMILHIDWQPIQVPVDAVCAAHEKTTSSATEPGTHREKNGDGVRRRGPSRRLRHSRINQRVPG